jgi:hypothetical protein
VQARTGHAAARRHRALRLAPPAMSKRKGPRMTNDQLWRDGATRRIGSSSYPRRLPAFAKLRGPPPPAVWVPRTPSRHRPAPSRLTDTATTVRHRRQHDRNLGVLGGVGTGRGNPHPTPHAGTERRAVIDVGHFFNDGGDPEDLTGPVAAMQLNDGPRMHGDYLLHARSARRLARRRGAGRRRPAACRWPATCFASTPSPCVGCMSSSSSSTSLAACTSSASPLIRPVHG